MALIAFCDTSRTPKYKSPSCERKGPVALINYMHFVSTEALFSKFHTVLGPWQIFSIVDEFHIPLCYMIIMRGVFIKITSPF